MVAEAAETILSFETNEEQNKWIINTARTDYVISFTSTNIEASDGNYLFAGKAVGSSGYIDLYYTEKFENVTNISFDETASSSSVYFSAFLVSEYNGFGKYTSIATLYSETKRGDNNKWKTRNSDSLQEAISGYILFRIKISSTNAFGYLDNISVTTSVTTTQYTVTFDTDGGSSINSQSVEEGLYATKPTDPTKDGFKFDGWYTDTTYETKFDFETMTINKETTIYAKWLEAFDVNYYVDDAIVNTVAIEENKTIGIENAFTYTAPENYTFSGWYLDVDCTIPFDFANTVISADTNIYGKTTENENYTISYYVNNELYKEEKVYVGNTIIEATYEAPEGYSFFGWYSDNSYTDEYDFTAELSSDVNVYGYTEEKEKFVISYYDGESLINEELLYIGSSIDYVPTKEGYKFVGWYKNTNLTEVLEENFEVSSSISLYAKFDIKPNSYVLNASDLELVEYSKNNTETIIMIDEVFSFYINSAEFKITGDTVSIIDGNETINITKRIGITGGSSFDNKQRLIGINADSKGIIRFACKSTGDTARTPVIFDNEGNKTLFENKAADKTNATINFISFEVSDAGMYYLGSNGSGINFYYVEFIPEVVEATPSVELKKQYNDDANPTAVRFFGVLTNITDTNTIESITLTIESNGRTGTKNINTIWKSVNVGDAEGSNGATFEEATNTYYVVYSIVNIPETEIGQEYSVTITVAFTEASGIETINANRTFIMGQE